MANNYFQFKEFIVNQEHSAMKVCTDACLFGAWVVNKITQGETAAPEHILDIGTGTGLLSLMLAQKTKALIDGVEIEENTFRECSNNFSRSSFAERLSAFHEDIKMLSSSRVYDLIICNPPFFEDQLSSEDIKKNIAKHSSLLTLGELIKTAIPILSMTGSIAVLLPFERTSYFEQLSNTSGLYTSYKMLVRQTPEHNYFRAFLILKNERKKMIEEEMTIKDKEGNYTAKFRELLKDYYLHLS